MYAIIDNGGKQYRVSPGEEVTVENLSLQEGTEVTISAVLMIGRDEMSTYGSPYIEGAKVVATVVKNGRARKVVVHKQRPRKVYRKTNGHRQSYSVLKVKDIVFGG